MITSIDTIRKRREAHANDARMIQGLGRRFGLSIVLPASPDNVEAIQAGPACLAEAADYFAIAEADEKDFVIQEFHEGVRQHTNLGAYNILEMFLKLRPLKEAS